VKIVFAMTEPMAAERFCANIRNDKALWMRGGGRAVCTATRD